MDVSIIIVNYNTYKLTSNCINSIIFNTKEISYEIILVDNNSVEPEVISYEDLFPSIKVVRLKENGGFAKGNNAGIRVAEGNYLLLLNSDTLLKENSIKITYDYLKKYPKVGVVSARLIFPDGTHQSVAQRFPSIRYQLIELFRLQKFLPRHIGGKLLLGSFFNHKYNTAVDWVWATYFMFPKKILLQLKDNKLDESFFMYQEDMKWCKDIKNIGYEVHFCAETEVIHLMGGSSGPKQSLLEINYKLFLERHYPPIHLFLINILNKILNK